MPGKEAMKEGKIQGQLPQEQAYGSKSTRSQQKKISNESMSIKVAAKHRP